jgi:hypothetical protein
MSIFGKELDKMLNTAGIRTCVRCHTQAPETQTEYTLIGEKHAWRCAKSTKQDGTHALEWYCPKCWKKISGKPSTPK